MAPFIRAIFRMDIGFYMELPMWPLYKLLEVLSRAFRQLPRPRFSFTMSDPGLDDCPMLGCSSGGRLLQGLNG